MNSIKNALLKLTKLIYLKLILYIDWYLFEIEDYTRYLNFRVNDSKNMSWK